MHDDEASSEEDNTPEDELHAWLRFGFRTSRNLLKLNMQEFEGAVSPDIMQQAAGRHSPETDLNAVKMSEY